MFPQSPRFGNLPADGQARQTANESVSLNQLMLDSPIARDRFSRFSRIAESFNSSKLSQSMLGHSMFNESSATLVNQTVTDLGNVSDISSVNLDLTSMLQLPNDNAKTVDESELDDAARLAIFQSFFELNQQLSEPQETFDLLEQFDQTCESNMLASKEMLDSKVRPESEVAYLNKFSSLIQLERNCWRLLKAMYSDRLLIQDKLNIGNEIDNMEIEEDIRLRLSDSELIQRVLERNSMLREMQIVIDWLESVYDEESFDKATFYSDGPIYWENTLHALKVSSKDHGDTLSLNKGRKYCQKMDPDASIRTGIPLHDLDKEDENRLFHFIFRLVRAGQLHEGKEIAEKLGYYWLSAALEGWFLYHDPNYKQIIGNDDDVNSVGSPSRYSVTSDGTTAAVQHLQAISGNPYRDLWKHTAWKSSKMEGTNLYERAIFAVFSGNRSILMPLCTKWMDKLWAYYKCSLDVHLENILIDSDIPKPDQLPRNNIELPDGYWDNKLSPEEIFHELSTRACGSMSGGFRSQFEEEYNQQVERCIILGKVDELIDHLYEWSKTIQAKREERVKQTTHDQSNFGLFHSGIQASDKSKEEEMSKVIEPNLLRFFAHLVIVLRNLKLIADEKQDNLCVEVLETYIDFLIEYKLIELIAFYVLYLPEHRQVKQFARLLEGIENDNEYRKLCIMIAKQSKLNLPAILTMVVENIRMDCGGYHHTKSLLPAQLDGYSDNGKKTPSLLKQTHLTSTGTEDDDRKISSLDWLSLDEECPQYMELLWQSNALIRLFLLERKLDQAKEIMQKLPADIINLAFNEWKLAHTASKHFNSIGSLDIDNIAREYICNKIFFEANESFQKWNHYLYNSKPREPTKPKMMNRLSDRVAYEQALKQYEQEMELWHQQVQNQATITSEKLVAFLCFPEGIWINLDDLREMQDSAKIDNDIESQLSSDIVAPPPPPQPLETQIEEVESNSDDLEVQSSVEFLQPKTGENVGDNLVLKMFCERKRQDWTNRAAQLDGLRRIYVPQMVFLLYSVYADSGNFAECLRIADIVADERSRLHSTFTREQMTDLLSKFREISIELLNQFPDPLGYVGN